MRAVADVSAGRGKRKPVAGRKSRFLEQSPCVHGKCQRTPKATTVRPREPSRLVRSLQALVIEKEKPHARVRLAIAIITAAAPRASSQKERDKGTCDVSTLDAPSILEPRESSEGKGLLPSTYFLRSIDGACAFLGKRLAVVGSSAETSFAPLDAPHPKLSQKNLQGHMASTAR